MGVKARAWLSNKKLFGSLALGLYWGGLDLEFLSTKKVFKIIPPSPSFIDQLRIPGNQFPRGFPTRWLPICGLIYDTSHALRLGALGQHCLLLVFSFLLNGLILHFFLSRWTFMVGSCGPWWLRDI